MGRIENFSLEYEKRELIGLIATFSLLAAIIGVFGGIKLLSSGLTVDDIIKIVGPYGPLGIIGFQFIQVLIAPLPPLTPVASGILYGVIPGTFYSFIGAALGSFTALYIARRFGRPAVEKFLSDDTMEKFDEYSSGHGYLPYIILFVFPGFPDDALCFIAGLTNLDLKKLFIIASVGRIPGIALLAGTGTSISNANPLNFIILSGITLTVSILSVKYHDQIESAFTKILRI